MAPSFSIIFLLSLLSSSCLARDSQFFNKQPSTTNTNNNNAAQPEQEQPDFVPDNENGYGLYGHESGQLPPSATTTTSVESEQPDRKYLPKNYNPVAYVTEPEGYKDGAVSFAAEEKTSYATNPTNYNNGATAGQDFYDPRQENDESAYRSYPTTTNDNNFYYNGGSRFNTEPQGTRYNSGSSFNTEPQGNRYNGGSSFNSEPQPARFNGVSGNYYNSEPQGTRFNGGNGNYYNNGFQAEELSGDAGFDSRENYFNNGAEGFRPQGMSDTRLLENGKYHYNIHSEKFSDSHPYEVLKGARPTNTVTNFGSNGEFP